MLQVGRVRAIWPVLADFVTDTYVPIVEPRGVVASQPFGQSVARELAGQARRQTRREVAFFVFCCCYLWHCNLAQGLDARAAFIRAKPPRRRNPVPGVSHGVRQMALESWASIHEGIRSLSP